METRRMKNKWKIAFWICLFLLIVIGIFGFYSVVDQSVTISYMKEGYSDTEADLETLIEIIGETDQTKVGIEGLLKDHRLYDYMNFRSDTIILERVYLIFENDRLINIAKQW